jgi:putative Mg2+ transporter-C (MgtC) family protein
MRTNAMVGIGSTLMTLASIQTFALFPEARNVDPARIAAQLVVGIGFIGAGVILREGGRKVVGLTTAATMWVVCGLGIAVGMGLYLEALTAFALSFFTFFMLTPIVHRVRGISRKHRQKQGQVVYEWDSDEPEVHI